MSKQIKELRQFMTGTVSSPSSTDIPDEAAIHSLNLETINEEGKLKGCKEEVAKIPGGGIPSSYVYQSDAALPANGDKFEFYISNKLVHTATISASDVLSEFTYKTFLETALTAVKAAYSPLTDYQVISRKVDNADVPIDTLVSDINVVDLLMDGISAADTHVKFVNSSDQHIDATTRPELFVGQRFKIDSEIMSITGWDVEASGIAYIKRGDEEGDADGTATTPDAHTDNADVYFQADFYAFTLLWDSRIDTPSFNIVFTPATGNPNKTFTHANETSYMEIHARNIVLKNKKMDDQIRTVSNAIFYDVDQTVTDGTPDSHKMKVVEDFYGELGSPEIKIPENPDVPGEPDSVSLVGAATATYIGTGNTAISKPLWLGQIFEKRFGNKVEGYHVEDAELKALDDGQAVYSLNHLDAPHTVTSGTTPAPVINNDHFVGSSPGKYFFTLHKNVTGGETNSWGKQFKSTMIGGEISSICSSKSVCKKMADTDNSSAGDFEPFYEGTWGGTQNNTSTNLDGHGDGDTSYHWISYKAEPNKLFLYAIRFFLDDTSKQKVLFNILREYTLSHKIVIDSTLASFTNWADGSKINRPPKPGSYISDILEKEDGTVYVQYNHEGGFTFDEEWLYTFNASAGGDHGIPTGTSSIINMKPITPPAIKLKNWGRDTNGTGKDWYMPEDVFNGAGLQGTAWIGQCGTRGCYANSFSWRPCDFLGYTGGGSGDPKHVYADGASHGYWREAQAESVSFWSGSEANNFPTYQVDGTTIGNWSDAGGSYSDFNGGFGGTSFGKSYGFTDYIVRPADKGLTNYSKNRYDVGVVAHLEGKQLTTGLSLGTSSHKWETGTFSLTRKKRYCTYNSIEPVLKDWNEAVIMTASKNSYGVRQRVMPDGTLIKKRTVVTTTTTDDDGDSVTSTTTTITNSDMSSRINGVTGASGANSIPNGVPGDAGHGRPQKNAFRFGSYYNLNSSSEGSYDYEPDRPFQSGNNHHIYQLLPSSTEQSGQSENNTAVSSPNGVKHINGVSKNIDDQSYLWMSVRKPEEDDINTYLQRWDKAIHSDAKEPVDSDSANGFTVSSVDHNPLELQDIGSSIIAQQIIGNNHRITLSPRVGTYRSGYVEFDPDDSAPGFEIGMAGDQIDSVNPKFWKYPNSALDFGMDITFTNIETDANAANFKVNKSYYWKVSMLYDGFQESPLTTWEFTQAVGSVNNFNKARLELKVSNPPKRVTHVVIYRKNAVEQFYRMVKEVSLSEGWIYNADKDQYKTFIVDEGKQGASYQAITGMPENLRDTSINYKLSTTALGSLVVADCYHPQINQGQNFVFKSEPNQFSNFNWSKSYTVLPNRPTHIIWWAGRIYAFDLSNIYKIEAVNLVLEDTFEGIGCIGPDSCVVTDIGMFFADYQGMYWHNGSRAENISRDIVHSSYGGDTADLVEDTAANDEEWVSHNWQNINHQRDPQVLYDGKTQSVYYCFEDKHSDGTLFSGAWVYSTTRKRWDLREIPQPVGKLTGSKNDIYLSDGVYLHKVDSSQNSQKDWTFHSKQFDMGVSSLNKVFTTFKLVFNKNSDALDFNDGGIGSFKIFVDETEITSYNKEVTDNAISYKITSSDKKGKKFRFQLNDMKTEIDSIGIVYRISSVK